jgi:hypothetical protein
MSTITVDHPATSRLIHSSWRLAVALLFAVALMSAAFVAGRAASTTRTVREVVTVPVHPASAPADVCRVGRPC